jgi:hypothetical protein
LPQACRTQRPSVGRAPHEQRGLAQDATASGSPGGIPSCGASRVQKLPWRDSFLEWRRVHHARGHVPPDAVRSIAGYAGRVAAASRRVASGARRCHANENASTHSQTIPTSHRPPRESLRSSPCGATVKFSPASTRFLRKIPSLRVGRIADDDGRCCQNGDGPRTIWALESRRCAPKSHSEYSQLNSSPPPAHVQEAAQ